jgi:hypothetical protein
MKYFGKDFYAADQGVSRVLDCKDDARNGSATDIKMAQWTTNMLTTHIAKMLDIEYAKNNGDATAIFAKHDREGAGHVSEDALVQIVKELKMDLSPPQFEWLCQSMKENGKLNYRNFVSRMLDNGNTTGQKSASTEEGLKALKQRVKINFKSLREAFRHYDMYERLDFFAFICSCFIFYV